MIGAIAENPGDGTLHIEMKTATAVTPGTIVHVVQFEPRASRWFPMAELVISSILGTRAIGRITALPPGSSIMMGDSISLYEGRDEQRHSLRIAPRQIDLIVGETATLEAELVDADGQVVQSVRARWRSTADNLANVYESGTVIALVPGEVVIIAQAAAGLLAAAIVHVRGPEIEAPDSILLFLGTPDTVRLRLTGPQQRVVSAGSFHWSIADERIAWASDRGVLVPVSPGATELRISGLNREFRVPVVVLTRPLEVTFAPDSEVLELVRGERIDVVASVRTASGEVRTGVPASLATSSEYVVAAAPDGRLHALRDGTANVTARVAGYARTWTVNVRAPVLRILQPRALLMLGDSVRVTARLLGAGGMELGDARGATWSTSGESAITLRGEWLHAASFGSATLFAGAASGGDSVRLHVLGELLVTIEDRNGRRVRPLSLRTGQLGPPLLGGWPAWSPSVSPDRSRIVFASTANGRFARLYIAEPDGGNAERLTPELPGALRTYHEHAPRWLSDGRRLAFLSNPSGSYVPYVFDLSSSILTRWGSGSHTYRSLSAASQAPVFALERLIGSRETEIILASLDGSMPPAVLSGRDYAIGSAAYSSPQLLPDGRGLVAARHPLDARTSGDELVVIQLGNTPAEARIRTLARSPRNEDFVFALSPDGTQVAYATRRPFAGRSTAVIVVGLDGVVQSTVALPGLRLVDITWATEVAR